MAKIIKASKGSPQELEMLVENRIAELEDRDITSSFVYPDDLEDLENGEYESHVTEPINCSAIVRPVGYKSWGVYLPDGHNHAEKLFESLSEDKCYEWIQKNEDMIQRLKSKFSSDEGLDDVEGASGSPQELQMLVENRLDRLESGVDASFVYPEDLIDLENGEYESHVTEPINAATDFKKLASDVLKFLANKGFDIASNSVRKYADAVAEYIEEAREHTNYSIEEWYKETKHNYPEDLRELPKVAASVEVTAGEGYAEMWKSWLDENASDETEREVLDYFVNTLGWNAFSDDQVRNYAKAVAEELDIVRDSGDTMYRMEDWYRDTMDADPEELEVFERKYALTGDMHRKLNESIESAVEFTEIELDDDEIELLDEIANRYVSSTPVSGDWDTETQHEQQAIADELGCTLDDARHIMIKYLGFEEDMFACTAIESAEGVPGVDFDDEYEETFEERYKPTATAISDWLGEHDQAYEDVCNFFGCSVEEDVADYADADQLIDWISEHEWLSEDFNNYFGHEWIESCTNTANISVGAAAGFMKMPVSPDDMPRWIYEFETKLYELFTNKFSCISDIEGKYIGSNNGIYVTVMFDDELGEDDMHVSYQAEDMPKDPEAAAYKIYDETLEDWGEDLADSERIFMEL